MVVFLQDVKKQGQALASIWTRVETVMAAVLVSYRLSLGALPRNLGSSPVKQDDKITTTHIAVASP